VMSLSDTYVQTVSQSFDELISRTKDPQKLMWARKQRLGTMSICMTNATAPNAVVGLLDMVVFATLKREALERYWVPTLLGDEGKGVVEAHRRGEADAWDAAQRKLSKAQCKQLRDLIDQWRREHPEQYYVAYTRFSDFDAYRNLSPQSVAAKTPGNLFSLFYVDPLAGLDPVTRELYSFRALSERLSFTLSRMPILAAYQIDLAVTGAIEHPQLQAFVATTDRFTNTTDRFVATIKDYPRALSVERDAAVKQLAEATSRERQAAIEQAAKSVALERETILKEIEAQDGRIRSIIGEVSKVVERVEQAGKAVNTSTADTVVTTEQATRRVIDHVYALSVRFALLVLVGIPVVLLTYRLVARWLLSPARDTPPREGVAAGGAVPN